MDIFSLNTQEHFVFFNRDVVLDLTGDASPGFQVVPAGPPPFNRHSEGCFVGLVTPNTEGGKKMFLPGDYILKINDEDATSLEVNEVQARISQGGKVSMSVECCAVARLQKEPLPCFKIRDKAPLPRKYWLNEAATRICWNSRVKKKEEANIRVGALKEVRLGRKTHSFERAYTRATSQNRRMSLGGDTQRLCASIIHGESYESLNLVFNDVQHMHVFVLACQYFVRKNKSYSLNDIPHSESSPRTRWLRDIFDQADQNSDKQLSFSEIKQLMCKLNLRIPKSVLAKKFYEADADARGSSGYGLLDFEEFTKFYKLLITRAEVGDIMISFGDSGHERTDNVLSPSLDTFEDVTMTSEQLRHFFQASQGEVYSLTECAEMIETFEPARDDELIGIDGFTRLLSSRIGAAYSFDHRRTVYQNMSRPLSHYYISSSHNTYLLQDQLRGPSDVEAYKRALLSGCRCVELDLWDGDDNFNFQPIIYHGYTMTSKILAVDVLKACKDYAFATSEFPLILSLEMHLGIDQQKIFAEDVKEVFGDLLYVIPADVETLPSPGELKHRIILKGKRLKEGSDLVEDDNESIETTLNDPEFLHAARKQKAMRQRLQSELRRRENNNGEDESNKKVKLAKEFSDVISLGTKHFSSKHFKALSEEHASEMSSFVEGKAEKLCLDTANSPLFVKRNIKQLARIYPAGRRLESTNYNPNPMWCAGCQIVALNFQTACREMNLNFGKFRDNGGCGYVLKPEELCDRDMQFNPTEPSTVAIEKLDTVTIRIISAQNLPKPNQSAHDHTKGEIIDPYVRISVLGLPGECVESKTSVVQNNGLNPRWKTNDVCQFDVSLPDVALLNFRVMDHDYLSKDDFVAQSVIPLKSLKEGFRHVQLYSLANTPIDQSTLFIHVRHSRFGEKKFSTQSRSSIRPNERVDDDDAPVGKKTKIPEVDNAFKSAPIVDIDYNQDALLGGIDGMRKFLRVDPALPFNDCVEHLIDKLKKEHVTLQISQENVVNGKVLNVKVTSPSTRDTREVKRIFDRLERAMRKVYTSDDGLSTKLSRSLRVLKLSLQNDKFNKICNACGIGSEKKKGIARSLLRAKTRRVEQASRTLKETKSYADIIFATLVDELQKLGSVA
eukprot:m.80967 g.80967  ORF g.80967 m.80967 type:complete len:1123 (-) comp12039_c0_seq1:286-3654(-)